ncbi:hypothetical protein [Agromyces sp. Marseille-P2726]|uniref:hypothetical protein n=1 Tax=Agromyces sp. Marseille-P2726 TaxID=2709132 RepID=UPI001570FEB7|nr:hypothetical protein [Agromyces sp. Marseille-P2726]
MRNDVRRRILPGAAAILMTLAALTACSVVGAGDASSSVAPETSPPPATASASPSEPAESDGALPNALPAEPGDCPLDRSAPGVVTFVVTADDDSTPIDLTYSVFRPDADPEIRSTTSVGPAVALLQTNCGNQAASAPWTFVATSATGGSLACAVFYGGKLVKSASDYAEGDVARGTAVDCTSHPGM